MVVLETNSYSNIFEVDQSLFDDVKDFLVKLSNKENKSFSYINDIGENIVVKDTKEFVIPTRDDIEAIYNIKDDDFITEDEMKKMLDLDV